MYDLIQIIPELVGLIRRRAKGSVFAGLSMYALGGRVREVAEDETAFFYRKAHFIIWLETVWEEKRFAEENRDWVNERFPALASVTTGSYVNFPYNELPDYLEEYYGRHVRKLEWIKQKYDPCNIFSFPQGIRRELSLPEPESFENDREEETEKQSDDAVYRGFRYVRDHTG